MRSPRNGVSLDFRTSSRTRARLQDVATPINTEDMFGVALFAGALAATAAVLIGRAVLRGDPEEAELPPYPQPTDPYKPESTRTLTVDANDEGSRVVLNDFEVGDALALVDRHPSWAVIYSSGRKPLVRITGRTNIAKLTDVELRNGSELVDQAPEDVLVRLGYSGRNGKRLRFRDWSVRFKVHTDTGQTHDARVYLI